MRRLAARLAVAAVLLGLSLAGWVWTGLPPRSEVRALERTNPRTTRLVEQRAEEARATGRRPRVDQTWVPLARVSRHLIHAVLASEDQGFFGHGGVDWKAIEESIGKNVERRRFARGGSTITQQLAKNLYFGTGKTPLRKLRELVVTRWLEEDLSKARILALYLNVIEWGDGVYGVEAAARRWYGKPASDLAVAEAAGLAAMIPNPRRINPAAGPARHERATRRVLWLMGMAGYIGRDVAGLGSEPPPEEAPGGEEPPPEPEPVPPGTPRGEPDQAPAAEPTPVDPALPEAPAEPPPATPAPGPGSGTIDR